MGNLSGESREQNRKDKVTRFRSVTYARQLGVTTDRRQFILFYLFYFSPFFFCFYLHLCVLVRTSGHTIVM